MLSELFSFFFCATHIAFLLVLLVFSPYLTLIAFLSLILLVSKAIRKFKGGK